MLGIDVSHWQGRIDWPKVAGAGIEFAFAKATEGTAYTDPEFAPNWAGMKAAGLVRGAYHYLAPNPGSAANQAEHFLEVAHPGPGDLVMLDFETLGGRRADDVGDLAAEWCVAVALGSGATPIVYTNPAMAAADACTRLGRWPLFIAHWTKAPAPTVPAPWRAWALWQYTDSGRVPGIGPNVDLIRRGVTLAGLRAYAVRASAPPRTTPAPPAATKGMIAMDKLVRRPGEKAAFALGAGVRVWIDGTANTPLQIPIVEVPATSCIWQWPLVGPAPYTGEK